jgi:hypothetical protein
MTAATEDQQATGELAADEAGQDPTAAPFDQAERSAEPTEPTPEKVPEPTAQELAQAELADWPHEGYDGKQPWDNEALGLRDDVKELDPGQANDVSPIVVRHNLPILTSGSGGPEVTELCRRLHSLGYETSVSRGENYFATVDQSVMDAVRTFRRDYGVREDPSGFGASGGDPAQLADNHIGPWTWEALIRASAEA